MDAGPSDASAPDASPPDATTPDAALPGYFEDYTASLFPTTPCPANLDAGIRAGCFTSWLTLSDIDQDNDLDILFANGGAYYNVGPADPSAVYLNDGKGGFRDVTGPWFNNATNRLRQVAVADIDGDGDRDIYQPGAYGVDLDKLWVQKAPGVFEDQAATLLPAGLKSYAGSAHFGDLDGDGDVDLAVADWGKGAPSGGTPWSSAANDPGNVWVYMNDGKGKFTQAATTVVPAPILVAARTGANDGGVVGQVDGGTLVKDGIWGRTPIDLDMADIDNDFDLDILVNMRNGQSRAWKNDGTGKFTDFTFAGTGILTDAGAPVEAIYNYTTTTSDAGVTTTSGVFNWDAGLAPNYPVKRGPYVYNQELCDIDSDGDLDMLLDNAASRPAGQTRSNWSQVLVNVGNGRFEDKSRDYIFGEAGGDDNAVKCADVNGDGKYDLVVASLTIVGEKLLLAGQSDGGLVYNSVPNAISQIRDPSLGIDMADLNGDGLLDLVTGQGESTPDWLDRIYLGVRDSKPDVTPPAFRAVETVTPAVGQPIVIRLAVRDRVTSESGEHVRSVGLEYKVNGGTTQTAKAVFIGGDLFRAVIPAQPNGTSLSITPVAVDRSNLRGTGTVMEFMIGTPTPDASVPDASDEDAAVDAEDAAVGEEDAAVGPMDATVEPTKPDAAATKADASTGTKADASTEDEEEEEEPRGGGKKDDGCSVGGNGQGSFSSALFALLGLSMLVARNARQRKRGKA